jgi:hypothetical protein
LQCFQFIEAALFSVFPLIQSFIFILEDLLKIPIVNTSYVNLTSATLGLEFILGFILYPIFIFVSPKSTTNSTDRTAPLLFCKPNGEQGF